MMITVSRRIGGQRCLNGSEAVGLAPVVIFAFIRLSTSPRIYAEPLSLHAFDLLESAGAGGNLMTDAQIGALALRYRATVHTADTDFTRLRDVLWRNPLTGQHGPR